MHSSSDASKLQFNRARKITFKLLLRKRKIGERKKQLFM
jgi:hypothetical protein